ncbi:MAG: MFS transporter [Chitinophagaceae bacterium]|nr:MFS transporter [Chitinophagaceae bacterium]
MYRIENIPLSLKNARIAVSALFFCAGFCFAAWAARIPVIQHKLQLNEAELGLLLLSIPVGLMVSLPVSGIVVTRYGSRPVAIFAGIFYSSLLPFLGLASAIWQLVIALFLFGFAGNLLNISMNAQGVDVEDGYGRSVMASFHGIWSLAGFTGALAGMLFISLNILPFFHFLIVAFIIWGIVFSIYKKLPARDIHSDSQKPILARPDKNLLRLGLIAFCCMVCEGTMFDWSAVYFNKVVRASAANTTLGYTAFMSTMAIGRFTGDKLVNRIGRMHMIRLSGLLIFTGLFLTVLFPNLIAATIGFLITGMGVSSVVPIVYGVAGRSDKVSSGVALASVSTIGYLGFLFGPPLIGLVAHQLNLRWSFSIIACLGLGTTIIAGMTKTLRKEITK